ncbi:MAG: 4-alpha-glucanotransferase [Flavisolibacter sp.]
MQLILKCTCPGIPDTYQGCELWDLSLVDPDNRRPVDYNKRIQFIHELKNDQSDANVEKLWKERNNGKIKLWLLQKLLSIRNQYPDVFLKGDYISLNTEGSYKDHVMAYARKYGQLSIIIILPLHMAAMTDGNEFNSSKIDWKDTRVTIPKAFGKEWENMLHPGEKVQKNGLSVGKLFQQLPLAILKGSYVNNERASGLLLHISSLPSQFGIGDMGPETKILIDLLKNNKQKYWQLLPLNPTEQGQGHSPYSSTSSHAGNILFISPEALSANGLLSSKDLQDHKLNNQAQVNFSQVENIKHALFDIAWQNYKNGNGKISKADVNAFVEKESAWLNDFALYMVLKKINNGKPWYEWEDKFKLRQVEALEQISQAHIEELNKIKWLQYIFNRQWKDLRNYCNGQGIKLIGDLPFYISYDSVDVWANKEIFAIDNNGNRIGMAGVPPDAFSEDGQLWGMPVFQWNVLKEHNYKWWIDRLRKNMELFDLIRLDHFRAFSAYWEVAANEQTARNGSWKPGPSIDFFNAVKEQLGQLPFIAEDLGDIDEAVYELRDAFDLPGMKVLQFAFSEDIAVSPYIPHNYDHNFIVYTGTHDNNTMLGWFRNEGLKDHERIEKYIGRSLSENDITDVFCKMALSSVARTSIIPVQDLLGLDENARMNKPSQAENNWSWRLLPGQLNDQVLSKLNEWTILFNRD